MQGHVIDNCPACRCKPNLIHRIFSITFNIPAITPFPPHERHGIPHMILPTICFCGPLRYRCWHPFSTSPCSREPRPIWELRKNMQFANHFPRPKLGFVSACLEMCPIFICFQLYSSVGGLTASVLLITYMSLYFHLLLSLLPSRCS